MKKRSIKEIEQKSQGTYELKQPTLYSCLKRLENQGFISAYWENSDIGGKRHYYKLTKKGRAEYESNINDWFSSRVIIDSLMGTKPQEINPPEEEPAKETPVSEPAITEINLDNSATQLTIDNEPATETVETQPRDFVIEGLDESESSLLQDYYKTDEDQINLFGGFDILSETDALDKNQSEAQTNNSGQTSFVDNFEDLIDSPATNENGVILEKYEGINIAQYKKETPNNYLNRIKDEDYDSNETTETIFPTIMPTINEDIEEDFQKSTISVFGEPKPEEDELSEENISLNPEDISYFSNGLNFGSNFEQYDSDDFKSESLKSIFEDNAIKEEDSETEFEANNSQEDEIEPITYPDYSDYNHVDGYISTPSISSRESNNIGTFTPAYTDIEYKEKLNQLSAFATSGYDARITTQPEEDVIMRQPYKDYAELKEELSRDGYSVKEYKKKEKDPLANRKYLLSNKIKCETSWIVYVIMLALLAVTYTVANVVGYHDLSLVENSLPHFAYYAIAAGILLILPLFYTTLYMLNKTKKIKPHYYATFSFIFAIVFFLVCLDFIFLLNILGGFLRFTQQDYNHLLWLLPAVCSTFLIFQSLIYSWLYKTKKHFV